MLNSRLLLVFLLWVNFLSAAHAQLSGLKGNGRIQKERRPISGVREVRIDKGIDLYIKQGSQEVLVLEADENILEFITTDLDNGELRISLSRNFIRTQNLKVHLTVRTLQRLHASGGADVYSEGVLRAEKMSCIAEGGSDIRLELDVKNLTVSSSGGSDAYLKGLAQSVKATASGGSDIKAGQLRADLVVVEASGGSDAYVYADMELTARASGGASVYYSGNPKKVLRSTSGGGDVTKR
ncbi:head GIN domain-containing protein [Arundinibacter roseus]|uniref:DUF2807 domain-containing protein n=1 Tax=Arundinibacter roseus TaxID=2070510 RepID=A0A4R4K7Z1_9BACT|nr:head GIN domain-containing protein [Arundinibacter roseus]TDB63483.1 DUF2807 domain-containing protein [Arundinibacter roseus]